MRTATVGSAVDRNLLIGWGIALLAAAAVGMTVANLPPRPLVWPAVPVVAHRIAAPDQLLPAKPAVRTPVADTPAQPIVAPAPQLPPKRPPRSAAALHPSAAAVAPVASAPATGQLAVAAQPGATDPQPPASGAPSTTIAPAPAASGSIAEIGEVDELPAPLSQASPAYPEWARRLGATGKVVAHFVVAASGKVEALKVTVVRGDARFAAIAAAAVQGWTFRPARKNGVAVAVRVEQELQFDLED